MCSQTLISLKRYFDPIKILRENVAAAAAANTPWIKAPPPNLQPNNFGGLFDPRLNPWGDFERIPWAPVVSGLSGDNNHIFLNQKRIDEGQTNYLNYRRLLYPNQDPNVATGTIFPTEPPRDPVAFRQRLWNQQLGNFDEHK